MANQAELEALDGAPGEAEEESEQESTPGS